MNNNNPNWANASWEGSRIAQLNKSLELTAKQRFEALEELAEVSDWLAKSGEKYYLKSKKSSIDL